MKEHRRVWVTRPTTGPQIDSCIIDSHVSSKSLRYFFASQSHAEARKALWVSPLSPLSIVSHSFSLSKMSLNVVYSICQIKVKHRDRCRKIYMVFLAILYALFLLPMCRVWKEAASSQAHRRGPPVIPSDLLLRAYIPVCLQDLDVSQRFLYLCQRAPYLWYGGRRVT